MKPDFIEQQTLLGVNTFIPSLLNEKQVSFASIEEKRLYFLTIVVSLVLIFEVGISGGGQELPHWYLLFSIISRGEDSIQSPTLLLRVQ